MEDSGAQDSDRGDTGSQNPSVPPSVPEARAVPDITFGAELAGQISEYLALKARAEADLARLRAEEKRIVITVSAFVEARPPLLAFLESLDVRRRRLD